MKRTWIKRGTKGFKTRQKPLRRKSIKKPLKKKATKADLWHQYGLEKPSYVRYSGRKGVYWWLFSRQVRQRDFDQFGGVCVDQCGKKALSWYEFDAGHYVAASKGGFGLLFDPMNVHGQLKACNNPTFSPHSSIGFGHGIDLRYGEGTAKKLWERRTQTTKEWSQREYDTKIRAMLDLPTELEVVE